MNDPEGDNESIDLETLQAQIDMSMSFAQEMVSSWVKPSKGGPRKANRDIEAELKEYIHRPPRLGVGAAIPESQVFSRDIARLKGHLIGKGSKRPRQEELGVSMAPDDGEDSRANAIRQKARPDPFSIGKTTKEKAGEDGFPSLIGPSKKIKTGGHETNNTVTDEVVPHPSPILATKRRKKKGRHPESQSLDNSHIKDKSLASTSSPAVAEASDGFSNTTEPSIDEVTSPKLLRMVSSTSTSTSTSALRVRRHAQTQALLQQPLLNLGSLGGNDSDSHAKSDVESINPRKKKRRKRRKNKKADNTLATLKSSPDGLAV